MPLSKIAIVRSRALGLPSVPAWVVGAATRIDEIHMMSPNNPEMGTAEGTWDYLMIVMVHEFIRRKYFS